MVGNLKGLLKRRNQVLSKLESLSLRNVKSEWRKRLGQMNSDLAELQRQSDTIKQELGKGILNSAQSKRLATIQKKLADLNHSIR